MTSKLDHLHKLAQIDHEMALSIAAQSIDEVLSDNASLVLRIAALQNELAEARAEVGRCLRAYRELKWQNQMDKLLRL